MSKYDQLLDALLEQEVVEVRAPISDTALRRALKSRLREYNNIQAAMEEELVYVDVKVSRPKAGTITIRLLKQEDLNESPFEIVSTNSKSAGLEDDSEET